MQAFFNRIKEPSTWAGLSALGIVFGLPPGTMDLIAQVVLGVTGLAAIALPEKKQP